MNKVILDETHFIILGVTRSSTKIEIKKAYFEQVKIWHPDRNPTKINEATVRTKKINEAYELLQDFVAELEYSYTGSTSEYRTKTTKPKPQPPPRPKGVKLEIERIRVKSSNIHSICYEPTNKVLQVQFLHGGLYQYYEVPAFIYFEMMLADSKGKYLNRNIFGRYHYESF